MSRRNGPRMACVALGMFIAAAHAQSAGDRPANRDTAPRTVVQGPSAVNDKSAAPQAPIVSARWDVLASDLTVARTFERWAVAAGHKLKWDASRDFIVAASDVYVGSFEGALQHVLMSSGIRHSDYPLEACIYANNPPLVRVTRQGEQSRECQAWAPEDAHHRSRAND